MSNSKPMEALIEPICNQVCLLYRLNHDQLVNDRCHIVADARAVVAWLALHYLQLSRAAVARYFNQHRSTISVAVRRVEQRAAESPPYARMLSRTLSQLKSD